MALFVQLAPVTARYRHEAVQALGSTVAALPPHLAEDFSRAAADSAPMRQSFARWMLHNHFLYGGFVQAVIMVSGRTVYTHGVEVVPWDRVDNVEGPVRVGRAVLEPFHRREEEGEAIMEVFGLAPESFRAPVSVMLDAELVPFARRWFLNLPSLQDRRLVDLVEETEARCVSLLERELAAGKPVSVIHFHFQDMRIYFEVAGEHRALEILDAIAELIGARLKKQDVLIRLSPGSFLVLCPGAREQQLRSRFKGVYFQTRSLVIDYEMHVHTVSSHPIRLNEIWKAIRL